MALGWLYVLSNDDMPGLVKIGQSAMDPHMRAAELQTTGVPSPFIIEYKALYDDFALLERLVHKELVGMRPSPSREFFRLSAPDAVEVIRRVAGVPPKYEAVLPETARTQPGDANGRNSAGIMDPSTGFVWLTANEAESEVRRGLSRDLRQGYSIPPTCPSCRKVNNNPTASGLFKFSCKNCSETWIQPVGASAR